MAGRQQAGRLAEQVRGHRMGAYQPNGRMHTHLQPQKRTIPDEHGVVRLAAGAYELGVVCNLTLISPHPKL